MHTGFRPLCYTVRHQNRVSDSVYSHLDASPVAKSSTSRMSSKKDYTLKIALVDSKNLATYTVQNKPSIFLKYWKGPLIAIICGTLLLFLLRLAEETGYAFDAIDIYIPWIEVYLANVEGWAKDSALLLYLTVETIRMICLLGSILTISILIVGLFRLQEPLDSMMIIKDMGIQLSNRDRWGFTTKEFIPMSDVIDIVIHEGFYGISQVIFYMCILTKPKLRTGLEDKGIRIVFPNFLPRKTILVDVCRQSREMLYGTTRRYIDPSGEV